MTRPRKAVIYVEGVVVHEWNIPKGVTLIVRDFDIEGVEAQDVKTLPSGQKYYESVYSGKSN